MPPFSALYILYPGLKWFDEEEISHEASPEIGGIRVILGQGPQKLVFLVCLPNILKPTQVIDNEYNLQSGHRQPRTHVW